jgi:hypothetical protein
LGPLLSGFRSFLAVDFTRVWPPVELENRLLLESATGLATFLWIWVGFFNDRGGFDFVSLERPADSPTEAPLQ